MFFEGFTEAEARAVEVSEFNMFKNNFWKNIKDDITIKLNFVWTI